MAEHPISEKHQALHDHGQDLDKVLSAMPSEKQFIQASEIFSSFATLPGCGFYGCWHTANNA